LKVYHLCMFYLSYSTPSALNTASTGSA
jgi:hypothetical protein